MKFFSITVLAAVMVFQMAAAIPLMGHSPCRAAELVRVSWEEYKQLYRESIEREIKESMPEEPEPQVHSIERVQYEITVGNKRAEGRVTITGSVLSGDPSPIPLFGHQMVLAKVDKVEGGTLISLDRDDGRIALMPSDMAPFSISFSFFLPVREDSRSRFIKFDIPRSISNSLRFTLPGETSLVDAPGLTDREGVRHFSATKNLTIRFGREEDVQGSAIIEIDSLSIIRVQGKRTFTTAWFLPRQQPPETFLLRLPPGAQYLSSSLNRSWISENDNNTYSVSIPPGLKEPFDIQYSVEEQNIPDRFSMGLPVIDENNGREGCFIVEEPDDGQISLEAAGLVSQLPISRLPAEFTKFTGVSSSYQRLPAGGTLGIAVKRFAAIAAPPAVLNSIKFFTSFEENGGELSVLVLTIPPGIDSQLIINSIPGAEIWSLKVNDRKKKLYTRGDGTWIIPLEKGSLSKIRLAYIRRGEKLGLQGRLETSLPATGLTAKNLFIGLALPGRVQLTSVEGPVTPARGNFKETPEEFVGKRYIFTRSFYRGEEIKVAFYYKEPVHESPKKKGASR